MESTSSKLLLSAKEAAATLGISPRTLWDIPETELPVVRIGRRVLYALSDLERYVAKRTSGRAAE